MTHDIMGLPFNVTSEDGHEYSVDLFQATPTNVNFLWEQAGQHDFLFSDVTRGDPSRFVRYLLSPEVVIFLVRNEENPVGIIHADQLRPTIDARAHYLFWDNTHTGRQRVLLSAIKWFMEEFGIPRLNMEVPDYAFAALRRLRKMGVRIEGRRRDAIQYHENPRDILLFGVTRRELSDETIQNARLERTEQEADWFGLISSDDILSVAMSKEH